MSEADDIPFDRTDRAPAQIDSHDGVPLSGFRFDVIVYSTHRREAERLMRGSYMRAGGIARARLLGHAGKDAADIPDYYPYSRVFTRLSKDEAAGALMFMAKINWVEAMGMLEESRVTTGKWLDLSLGYLAVRHDGSPGTAGDRYSVRGQI